MSSIDERIVIEASQIGLMAEFNRVAGGISDGTYAPSMDDVRALADGYLRMSGEIDSVRTSLELVRIIAGIPPEDRSKFAEDVLVMAHEYGAFPWDSAPLQKVLDSLLVRLCNPKVAARQPGKPDRRGTKTTARRRDDKRKSRIKGSK